jgi:hypothetical protein
VLRAVLVFFTTFFLFTLKRVNSNLFIVLLKSCEILPGLRKLTFFHPLSNVPKKKRNVSNHMKTKP